MSKCIICGKEYKAKRVTSKYCGAKCRKLAFHGEHHGVSVPEADRTLTDACGAVHKIDFEGRRKDYELLKLWSKGKGYLSRLGNLARSYSIINGYLDTDGSLTAQGRRYLGI